MTPATIIEGQPHIASVAADEQPLPVVPLDDELGKPSLSPALRSRHRSMLWLSAAVLLLAFLFEVHPDQRIALRFLPRFPLPASCMSRAWFGVDCPGCGLTRSIVHLAHGDWQGSLAMHRLGWLIGLLVVLQFPYRLAALAHDEDYPLGRRTCQWVASGLIFLLIANWLLKAAQTLW